MIHYIASSPADVPKLLSGAVELAPLCHALTMPKHPCVPAVRLRYIEMYLNHPIQFSKQAARLRKRTQHTMRFRRRTVPMKTRDRSEPAPRHRFVLTMVSQVSSQHIQKFTIGRWTLERRSGDMFQKRMVGAVPYRIDQITDRPLHSGAGGAELLCGLRV